MTVGTNGASEIRGEGFYATDWIYFDTNCISQLAKMSKEDQPPQIRQFLDDKYILITSSILQELRHTPDILVALEYTFSGSNLFLVPDMATFWYTEILNLRNRKSGLPLSPIQFQPLPVGFFDMLPHQIQLEEAWRKAEKDLRNRYFDTVELDIGSNLDERDLCVHIFSVVNKLSKEWIQINLRTDDFTPSNFPSFYTFYYTYYFRYAKNQVKPELNDFLDLVNCLPIPYCERYYGERKFTTILKDSVQGRKPPTAFQLVKRLHQKGWVDQYGFQVIRKNKAQFDRTSSLLPNVKIYNFAEMLEHIRNSAS